ncbi:MAG: nuclease-related domain-containing protein [Methanobacteriota archaeon]
MRVLKNRADTIYVWKHINLNRSRMLLFMVLLVLAFMLFIMNTYPFAQMGLLLIPLSYGLGLYTYRKMVAWTMGATGELRVVEELSKLDDGYILLNNVVVPPNWGDADHIILGPNGLFVVETKAVGGSVECNGDSWSRFKVGGRGFSYPVKIGNPSSQVKRNAKSLKDLVLKHGSEIFQGTVPHIWVHAGVVFTNDDLNLKVENPTVSVLRLHEVVDYIKSEKSKFKYSEKQLSRMASVILRESS